MDLTNIIIIKPFSSLLCLTTPLSWQAHKSCLPIKIWMILSENNKTTQPNIQLNMHLSILSLLQRCKIHLYQSLPAFVYITMMTSHRKTFFDLVTLTYDHDLRTHPRYPPTWPICRNSSMYVCPFGCENCENTHSQAMPKLHLSWLSF